MKIFCVGRNYAEHAKELNNAIPDKPVIFMKPRTALLIDNKPFFHPEFSNDIHYETELVYRVCKNGKYIEPKFALKYVDAVTVGIDFTARDIQNECKQKGLPWELAKAFDNSAAIGKWKMLDTIPDINDINFCMYRNRKLAQKGNSKDMLFSLGKIISFLSVYFTLLKGDLIYTGTPVGVAAIAKGDKIEAFIENDTLLEFDIK